MSIPTQDVPNPGYRPLQNRGAGLTQTLPNANDGWTEFRYGPIDFGPFTTIDDYNPERVYDERGNPSYVKFTLTCTSTVTGHSIPAADILTNYVRQTLETPKLPLILRGRAVGYMVVNTSGIVDVKNGPMPTVTSWEVMGQLTTIFRWTLTWCLPDCPDGVYTADMGYLSNTYTVSTTVDGSYTTRTINGKLVIPQNSFALGARFPADAATRILRYADGQPGSIFPTLPPYFRRGPYQYTLNQDRSELAYSVTDTQTGRAAPPPGCVHAEESYELHTAVERNLFGWTATFNGRYEVPFNGDTQDAVNAFMEFVSGKMFFLNQMLIQQKDDKGNPVKDITKASVPIAFSLGNPDSRGKRVVTLSFSIWFVSGLKNVIEQSGVWAPVSNGQWKGWFDTMGYVFNPYGTAGLDFDYGKDTYVDACAPNTYDLGQKAPTTGVLKDPPPQPQTKAPNINKLTKPQPGLDWAYYVPWIVPIDDAGVGQVRTLSGKPLTGSTDLFSQGFNAMIPSSVKGIFGGISSLISGGLIGSLIPQPPVSPGQGGGPQQVPGIPTNQSTGVIKNKDTGTTWGERRAPPFREFWFCGMAGRYGKPVPQPNLTFVTIQGRLLPAIYSQRPEDGPPFWQRAVPMPPFAGGTPYPMYFAFWCMRYTAVGLVPPGPIDPPPNPYAGV